MGTRTAVAGVTKEFRRWHEPPAEFESGCGSTTGVSPVKQASHARLQMRSIFHCSEEINYVNSTLLLRRVISSAIRNDQQTSLFLAWIQTPVLFGNSLNRCTEVAPVRFRLGHYTTFRPEAINSGQEPTQWWPITTESGCQKKKYTFSPPSAGFELTPDEVAIA